jgi:hypothetical protein
MTLGKKDISIIIDAYLEYNGDLKKASHEISFSPDIIRKYWKLYTNYKSKPKRKKLTPNEIKEVILAHKKYQGYCQIAARELGVSSYCILKYWKQEGLLTRHRGGNTRNLEERLNIKLTKPRTASS